MLLGAASGQTMSLRLTLLVMLEVIYMCSYATKVVAGRYIASARYSRDPLSGGRPA
jgi:hypothetical protein